VFCGAGKHAKRRESFAEPHGLFERDSRCKEANHVHTAEFEKQSHRFPSRPMPSADLPCAESKAVIFVIGVVGWVIMLIAFVVLSAAVRNTSVKNTRSKSARFIPSRLEEQRSSVCKGQEKPGGLRCRRRAVWEFRDGNAADAILEETHPS
jgi:hypothetical protein